jgi:thioredoxin 1
MSSKSILAAVVIVGAVVALPLIFKSTETAPAAHTAAAPASVVTAPSSPDGTPCGADGAQACEPVQSTGALAIAAAPPALPRFVDLGTTSCKPCKAMLGVMAELEERYPDSLIVEFINVKDEPGALQEHGFRAIPSQLFLAPDGRELFRNTGVMRADAVAAKWAELGYPLAGAPTHAER